MQYVREFVFLFIVVVYASAALILFIRYLNSRR